MKIKKFLKWIPLILLLIVFIITLVISENSWPAWVVLGISVVSFSSFLIVKKRKKSVVLLLLLGIIVLNVGSYMLTNQISFFGAVMSKIIVPAVAPTFAADMMMNREDSHKANQELETTTWDDPDYIQEKITINGVKLETITPKSGDHQKLIYVIHGGAFVVGLKNSNRDFGVKLSKLANQADIVLADYTTSEVAPYPAAFNDCVATYEWILSQGYSSNDIIVIGDSAGGNLSLALGLYLRDQELPLPAGIITISAFANMKCNTASYYENADNCILGPYFGNDRNDPEQFFYTQGCSDILDDPYLSPVYGDYHGFPKLLMQVGSREIVLDDALTIVANAKAAGVDATATVFHGMWHVFQTMGFDFPENTKAWVEIESFIADCFDK